MTPGAAQSPKPGDVLAGKYRIERVLGQGGMGTVALATQLAIDEPVAVKVLHASLASDADLVLRFQREAKAARKIRSEHVVRILDVGTLENGAPYIVMEYLEGIDLDALLHRDGPQTIFAAVDTLLQAMEALAEAHVQGMVHRDLKPANLFLAKRASGEPLVKVLDFGISKVTGNAGIELALTKTNTKTLGSPLYMAPEQMRSLKNVDARTDIWALGVILYELLAGKPPFDGESLTELTAMILQDAPRPLHSYRRDMPHGLAAVVERCLSKDPAARFQDVAAFAADLAPYCSPAGRISVDRIAAVLRQGSNPATPRASTPPIRISAPPRPNITTGAPQTLGVTLPAPVPRAPAPAPSRLVPIAIGVSASLLIGGLAFAAVVFYVVRKGHEPPVPARASAPAPEPAPAPAASATKEDPPAALVQIDPMSGVYGVPFDATLSSPSPDATIFYTVDGSKPTPSSQPSTGAVRITKSTILKAVAVSPGHSPSSSHMAIYTAGPMPIRVTPAVWLGETACGRALPPRPVLLTNVGREPLAFTVAMTSGEQSAFTVTSESATLAPNAATNLLIVPKAMPISMDALEGYADTITITDSRTRIHNLSVRMRGIGEAFEVPSRGPLDFEAVRAHKTSDPVAIRVRNPSRRGPAYLEAKLRPKSDYRVTPPSLHLDPESEGEFSVTFAPSSTGSFPDSLEIALVGEPICSAPVSIDLRGTGK